jgi:hypothetical protein
LLKVWFNCFNLKKIKIILENKKKFKGVIFYTFIFAYSSIRSETMV